MKTILMIAATVFLVSACDSPQAAAARRAVFNECMDKAGSIAESKFALFNKGDDLISSCEAYALRNSGV